MKKEKKSIKLRHLNLEYSNSIKIEREKELVKEDWTGKIRPNPRLDEKDVDPAKNLGIATLVFTVSEFLKGNDVRKWRSRLMFFFFLTIVTEE